MMTKEKIDRINELAAKAKTPQGLTKSEIKKRDKLRRKYIDTMKSHLREQLENIEFVDE